jgi:hypothetical protein
MGFPIVHLLVVFLALALLVGGAAFVVIMVARSNRD